MITVSTEIIEKNKVIALFMGRKFYGHTIDRFGPKFNTEYPEMKYHKSWEWIMPVVEKLAKDYNISIRWYDGDCIATATNTSIEETEIADTGNYIPAISNVWQTVVKAITYHNQNNK